MRAEAFQQLAENIEALERSGQRMRDVLERFAAVHGITIEEAERRVEAARQRLFPDA